MDGQTIAIDSSYLGLSPPARPWIGGAIAAIVGALALVILGLDLGSEPHFVDESAFIAQAYYADHLLDGRWHHPDWLTYPAIDLPPLPKYLIGGALRIAALPRPGPEAARSWYRDTSTRPETPAMLGVSRWPSVACGVVGCLAIFGVGTLVRDHRLGLLAAVFLLANPLYRSHSRRAMADAPAEAFVLVASMAGLWAWKRALAGRSDTRTWLGWAGCGVACGLAVLSKLNGGLAPMIVAGWVALGLLLPRLPAARRLAVAGGGLVVAVVAFLTFLGLNPTLTARPTAAAVADAGGLEGTSHWGRTAAILRHRASVSATAADLFPHNALTSPPSKVAAVAVQGFGRFGPLGPRVTDSTVRFDGAQDRGTIVWLPLVIAGFAAALCLGTGQVGRCSAPTGWALASMATTAIVTVTAFIPLAWDRYFLPIQPSAALLGGLAILVLADRLTRRLRRGARP